LFSVLFLFLLFSQPQRGVGLGEGGDRERRSLSLFGFVDTNLLAKSQGHQTAIARRREAWKEEALDDLL